MLEVAGGSAAVVNNVFEQGCEYADSISIATVVPGSEFRFNTIINTRTVTESGVALCCDPSLTADGNIFAYNSTATIGLYCTVSHSLFDVPGAADAMNGVGNVSGDVATFFVDRGGRNYDLSAGSPAKGLASMSTTSSDILGRTRPLPAGSMPDAGAFEAP